MFHVVGFQDAMGRRGPMAQGDTAVPLNTLHLLYKSLPLQASLPRPPPALLQAPRALVSSVISLPLVLIPDSATGSLDDLGQAFTLLIWKREINDNVVSHGGAFSSVPPPQELLLTSPESIPIS